MPGKLNLYNVTLFGEGRFVLAESLAAAVALAEKDANEEMGEPTTGSVESISILCEAEDIIGWPT